MANTLEHCFSSEILLDTPNMKSHLTSNISTAKFGELNFFKTSFSKL